ncbi:hypothetical protein, partial [Stenotrophomonas maltophilia]|uniref:hypothetical protein n=1 Tax=Stenotrophomonas maltophilia TaxID=40324 RepID=UPI001952DF86
HQGENGVAGVGVNFLKHEMYLQVYESRYLHNKPEVGEGRGDVGKLSTKIAANLGDAARRPCSLPR